MKHIIQIILLYCIGNTLVAQNCTQTQAFFPKNNASGFAYNAAQQTKLNQDALEILNIKTAELCDEFGVFEFAYYRIFDYTEKGYQEDLAAMKAECNKTKKYYLLLVRKIDRNLDVEKIDVDFVLPTDKKFSCLTPMQRSLMKVRIEKAVSDKLVFTGKDPFIPELVAISTLKEQILKILDCCYGNKGARDGCTQDEASFQEILDYLALERFSLISEVKDIELTPSSYPNIQTQYKLLLKGVNETSENYNYTDILSGVIQQAKGEALGQLVYFDETTKADFNNYKKLRLEKNAFICDIVILKIDNKLFVFVYLESEFAGSTQLGTKQSKMGTSIEIEDFIDDNFKLCNINLLSMHTKLLAWEEDGHLWTSYTLARLMGISEENARLIGCYAEWYDHYCGKDSKGGYTDIKNLYIHPSKSGLALNWTKDIGVGTWADRFAQRDYHGLTGGPQKEVLDDAVKRVLDGELYQLHKVGDAWAHSYMKDGIRTMYGDLLGIPYIKYKYLGNPVGAPILVAEIKYIKVNYTIQHAVDNANGGGNADILSLRKDVYLQYVHSLLEIFNDSQFKYNYEVKNKNPSLKIFEFLVLQPTYSSMNSSGTIIVDQKIKDTEENIKMLQFAIDVYNGISSFSVKDQRELDIYRHYLEYASLKYKIVTNIYNTTFIPGWIYLIQP